MSSSCSRFCKHSVSQSQTLLKSCRAQTRQLGLQFLVTVLRVDNAIHWITLYLVNNGTSVPPNSHLLGYDLSAG